MYYSQFLIISVNVTGIYFLKFKQSLEWEFTKIRIIFIHYDISIFNRLFKTFYFFKEFENDVCIKK